jgi:hypothetical protein
MDNKNLERIDLSAKGLLRKVRSIFDQVKEPQKGTQGIKKNIGIGDCLMSALAVFKLKYPSLLQFEEHRSQEPIEQNLRNLFGLKNVPCDTYMRERLDEIDPREIRKTFTAIFASLQRGKILEKYAYLEGKYLLLADGTGFFSSKNIHCKNCCEKHHKDGSVTYYHQMLAAVLAHPDYKEVIPLCPEPIMKEDGATKNDCERNASERLLKDFRREHPHLPVILVEDALSSNGPHLKLLKKLNISFISVVKPDGNKSLFDWIDGFCWENDPSKRNKLQGDFSFTDEEGISHHFKFVNNCPLNDAHEEFKVNFLKYWTTDSKGKQLYHNTWITDIQITKENAFLIARGGRARWHIENETFNTLKNQDYHFEHNFGHGHKNLSTVFARLMMLAFLIDQAEQICCKLFQGALSKMKGRKTYLWRKIKEFFNTHIIISWEALYRAITSRALNEICVINTS